MAYTCSVLAEAGSLLLCSATVLGVSAGGNVDHKSAVRLYSCTTAQALLPDVGPLPAPPSAVNCLLQLPLVDESALLRTHWRIKANFPEFSGWG